MEFIDAGIGKVFVQWGQKREGRMGSAPQASPDALMSAFTGVTVQRIRLRPVVRGELAPFLSPRPLGRR